MQSRLPRRVSSLVLVATAALVAGLFTAPATAASRSDLASQSTVATKAARGESPAERARRATQVFKKAAPIFASDDREATGHGARDATILLRDLKKYQDALTPQQKAEMKTWKSTAWKMGSQRPGSRTCANNRVAVVHCYNRMRGFNKRDVLRAVGHTHGTYRGAGYKSPLRDGGRPNYGPDRKLDIYVGDLGAGLYGYCTTDDPRGQHYGANRWAYCVINSNYNWVAMKNIKAMQVTIAHEYFHAVQFAYDIFEDGFFMESTAAWAEERVYDHINDNRQYLRNSPLSKPLRPMALFDRNDGYHYGAWIWWEYLTRVHKHRQNGMETVVRDTWRRADSGSSYSLRALYAVLSSRGTNIQALFTRFHDANRRPARTYTEGTAPGYRRKPLSGHVVLRRPGWQKRFVAEGMRQLSGWTYLYKPKGLPNKRIRLRLRLNMPNKAQGYGAVVSVYTKSGRVNTNWVRLNKWGNGVKVVPFSSSRIQKVEVTMVNGSTAMKECRQNYTAERHWPCDGLPRINNSRAVMNGTVIRR